MQRIERTRELILTFVDCEYLTRSGLEDIFTSREILEAVAQEGWTGTIAAGIEERPRTSRTMICTFDAE